MKRQLVVFILALCLLCGFARLGFGTEVEEPDDRVRLTVWLDSVKFDDDQDFWSEGDMYFASWARFKGTPEAKAQTRTSPERGIGVDSGESQGVSTIIYEEEHNCPLPSIEIVLHFWDDDDSTAEKIGKIATALGEMSPDGTTGKVLTGLGKIIDAINEGEDPSRDELGTFKSYDLQLEDDDGNASPCPLEGTMSKEFEVKLKGGEGASNGTIKLVWTAPKIGTCTDVLDAHDSASTHTTTDLDDIKHTEIAQNSFDELILDLTVWGEDLNLVMEPGHTRTFVFGIDADFNRTTGVPVGSLTGMEWCITVSQSSNGVQQDTVFNAFYWYNGAWLPVPMQPHDMFISGNMVRVVVNRSDLMIPSPTSISGVAAIYRNGDEVDVAPNDPDIIHRLEWIEDVVPPIVTAYNAMPAEVGGDVERINVTFSEKIDAGTLNIQIQPAVPFTYEMNANNLTITPEAGQFGADGYTVSIIALDMAGNLLDGNGDGQPGDPYQFDFLVPDRRFLPTDELGEHKPTFNSTEDIYVTGSGFEPGMQVMVYLIRKGSQEDGGQLMDFTLTGPTTAIAGDDGVLPVVNISGVNVQHEDEYSIVADVDGDGFYSEGIDRLWHPNGNGVFVLGLEEEPVPADPQPVEPAPGEPVPGEPAPVEPAPGAVVIE